MRGRPSTDLSTPLAAMRPTRPYTPRVTSAGLSSASSHFSDTVSVTSLSFLLRSSVAASARTETARAPETRGAATRALRAVRPMNARARALEAARAVTWGATVARETTLQTAAMAGKRGGDCFERSARERTDGEEGRRRGIEGEDEHGVPRRGGGRAGGAGDGAGARGDRRAGSARAGCARAGARAPTTVEGSGGEERPDRFDRDGVVFFWRHFREGGGGLAAPRATRARERERPDGAEGARGASAGRGPYLGRERRACVRRPRRRACFIRQRVAKKIAEGALICRIRERPPASSRGHAGTPVPVCFQCDLFETRANRRSPHKQLKN